MGKLGEVLAAPHFHPGPHIPHFTQFTGFPYARARPRQPHVVITSNSRAANQ